MKDLIQLYDGWLPNEGLLKRLKRAEAEGVIEGCAIGHPKEVLRALVDMMGALHQDVCYVLERDEIGASEMESKGGLRLLQAIRILTASQYNQCTFVSAGGLRSMSKIVRNGINQLHAYAAFIGDASIQGQKADYLCDVLTSCLRILSQFLDDTNLVTKQHHGMMHPLIADNICSSQAIQDTNELLRVLASSSKRKACVVRMLALDLAAHAYKINADPDLLSGDMVEPIMTSVGSGFKGLDGATLRSALASELTALRIVAAASSRSNIVVQNFVNCKGHERLCTLVMAVLRAAIGGRFKGEEGEEGEGKRKGEGEGEGKGEREGEGEGEGGVEGERDCVSV